MTLRPCAKTSIGYLLIASALISSSPSSAAADRKASVASAGQSAVRPTTDIIPLPLNPTLPAGQRLCSAKTASGLGYSILRSATGNKPAETDVVLVNYIGYLASTGAVFDQGMQVAFPVNGVIPGFSAGLQMLSKLGIARFCIPASMGYGTPGAGPIPADADLVFQVELIDFKTAAEVEAMRKAEAIGAAASPSAAAPRSMATP